MRAREDIAHCFEELVVSFRKSRNYRHTVGQPLKDPLPHTHTAKVPGRGPSEVASAAESMELVITYYCKTRNIRYSPDCGWPELLVPMLALDMGRADLFNCFYAVMTKYIPRYDASL